MKRIRSARDLAVNGAPPAFRQPLHVGRPHAVDRAAFFDYANRIFDRRRLTNDGPVVRELERRIADMLQVRHCVAMANGTLALEGAVRALGLKGEVIVPSYTFIATVHALHWQAITPVFADIDPHSQTIDPAAVRRVISPRTTGIVAVHLWGRPACIDQLQGIADEHGLKLIFDSAHAFGCSYRGRMIGGFGACEVLSFHATKFFHTFEGGAVVTDDTHLANTLRLMRNFGFSGIDSVASSGTNAKMTEMAAAMGLVNLDGLDNLVATNRRNYEIYREALKDIAGVRLLPYDERERHNYQYIVLDVAKTFPVSRDRLVRALRAENILARRYFWPGCHNMQPYCDLYPQAGLGLPNTRAIADRVVVLPTGDQMNEEKIRTVVSVIATLGQPPADSV